MRVGLVFHHDPRLRPPGIDVERLTYLAAGLADGGAEVDILAPIAAPARLPGPYGQPLSLRPLSAIREGRYQILKTCYHPGIDLVEGFDGPLVCRLVRVVDRQVPARDEPRRERLLEWQRKIHRRATALAFNNPQNQERWQRNHGPGRPSVLTPTGCPEDIPPRGPDPYGRDLPAVLFLGSLAGGRMVDMLNRAAEALSGLAEVHLVGLNKSRLYGEPVPLSSRVIDHGTRTGPALWDFMAWAAFGISLAAGPDEFDNDSSKVVYYLRAGLPVLCEEPVLQRGMVAEMGMGHSFAHGDVDGMLARSHALLAEGVADRGQAMARMAREHSWKRRAETYLQLFNSLVP